MMIRNLTISATALEVARPAADRLSISFGVGNTANSASVMFRDGPLDASVTEGFPLTFSGGMITFTGAMARRRWSSIRLAATDAVVAVVEEFHESLVQVPSPGVPL